MQTQTPDEFKSWLKKNITSLASDDKVYTHKFKRDQLALLESISAVDLPNRIQEFSVSTDAIKTQYKQRIQKFAGWIEKITVDSQYTQKIKDEDLNKLKDLNPDTLLDTLPEFQDAMIKLLYEQFSGDAWGLGFLTQPATRMGTLIELMNLRLYRVMSEALIGKRAGNSGNWANLSAEETLPCLLLVIQSSEKKLAEFILKQGCKEIKYDSQKKLVSDLIDTLVQEKFLTAQSGETIKSEIRSGVKGVTDLPAYIAQKIFDAIAWPPGFDAVPYQIVESGTQATVLTQFGGAQRNDVPESNQNTTTRTMNSPF